MVILIIVALASLGVIGDLFLKLSGQTAKPGTLFLLGVGAYVLTAFGWYYVMKYIPIGKLGVYYAITTVTLLMVIGVFYFDEKFTRTDGVAILLAITAIVLLGHFE